MNFPIVPEYQKDILNINPENFIPGEPFTIPAGAKGHVVVPRYSPFFVESLKVYNANGQLLGADDYRIYSIMGGLTSLTSQDVSCMIEFTNPDIREGTLDYDVVGHFSLFDSAFLKLVNSAVNDDRPVWWENLRNKPTHFRPKIHSQSLIYEIVSMKDMVELVDMLLGLAKSKGKTILEIKFEHYLNLLIEYIKTYKTELLTMLERHKGSNNAHGFDKTQAELGLVDNFPTARGSELLQPRKDRHLTPDGIKTIMDVYGFNSSELLAANKLPISQFGNSNFIPPSIDGSFEGLGGVTETAGICMESDGSLVFLENRFDGRVKGLYYSVVDNPYSLVAEERKRMYTGYRYTHQLFAVDNTNPDLILQGSGDEVIFVGDSSKEKFYLGLTNGSLDPAKHVYSRVDVTNILSVLPGTNLKFSNYMRLTSVVLMGDWIYLIMASAYNASKVADAGVGYNYRYLFRVPTSSVAQQLPVTPTKVNLTFKDGDGVQYTNSPNWRWCKPVFRPGGNNSNEFSRYYFPIVQTANVVLSGIYRSQMSYACPIPNKPGKFLLRFAGAWWGRYTVPGTITTYSLALEMLYEFDVATNVMTLINQTPVKTLDFTNLPNSGYPLNTTVFNVQDQGGIVLKDGSIVTSMSDAGGFPRSYRFIKPGNYLTRYATMNRQWNTSLGNINRDFVAKEDIISPLASTIKSRSFILGNGGDFYSAPEPTQLLTRQLFYRNSPGRLGLQPGVTNLLIPNLLSRPLSNDVRLVNSRVEVGAASVTVPTAQLSAVGTDLALSTFCVGVQKQFMDLSVGGGEWFSGTDPNDIPITSNHSRRIESNGTITVVPTETILYPAAIVERLKREVQDLAGMNASAKVLVTVSDPTGYLTNTFGWLPVMVMITWANATTLDRHGTLLSITPTYSGTTNKVVTGYTVLDKKHWVGTRLAVAATPTYWDASVGEVLPNSTFGSMRAGYHVNGNVITGFFDPAIRAQVTGSTAISQATFRYDNKTTRRWNDSLTNILGVSEGSTGNHMCVVPDDGVVTAVGYETSTGGAGTIFSGNTKNILYGSVYPQVGWSVFAQIPIKVTFEGKPYMLQPGFIDLREVTPNPANKTFYMYTVLRNGEPVYVISEEKRLETPYLLWVAKIITGPTQILTIERFNVVTLNSNRISEIKRGNCIPASSGLANEEGQLPWLRNSELLP